MLQDQLLHISHHKGLGEEALHADLAGTLYGGIGHIRADS